MEKVVDNNIQEIADLIEKCLEGQIEPSEALGQLDKLNNTVSHKIVNRAIHLLHHYVADEDIRKKDPAYGVHQTEKLRSCINEIRAI
jgi:methanogenic corrinoid protein MtbC1